LFVSKRKAVFGVNKKKEKRLLNLKNQLKIQTFSGSTTFGQDKKTNQLSDFKTKEKLLENIDLQTKKLKFYSLICDSFVLTENEEKNIKNSTAFVRFG
jgi:hypothetical protein